MLKSIRQTFIWLALGNLVAIVILVFAYTLYQGAQDEISASYQSQYNSYLLADELRQSSDDLTRLGRTYVVTGDTKYEKQYFDILDIRNGKKPRPESYHRVYWDFFTVGMQKPRADTQTIALQDLMKQAGFTDKEFGYLKQAQANSDGLVGLEVKAMNAVKGLFPDANGKYTVKGEPDFKLARTLVHSNEYHAFKADIMKPLDQFYVALEARTNGLIKETESIATLYSTIVVVSIVASVFLLIFTGWVFYRRVINPMQELTGAMTQVADNNLEIDVPGTESQDELGDMSRALNVFKENSIERRRLRSEHAKETEAKEKRAEYIAEQTAAFERQTLSVVESVTVASSSMRETAETLHAEAGKSLEQASTVATASEGAANNVNTVSAATAELSSTISEIGQQVNHSNQITDRVVERVGIANKQVQSLTTSANEIGNVMKLITDIAEQTNLLALNATIEAARAGEAGKGFAVVASEVKNLANQTSKATDEIHSKIEDIQSATSETVSSIDEIGNIVNELSEISTSISAAIEEQGAATQEISRSVDQAAQGTSTVSSNITSVQTIIANTEKSSQDVLTAAEEMGEQASSLRGEVLEFLKNIKQAS